MSVVVFTKMISKVKLISSPINEFEKEAQKLLNNRYEPVGSVSTVVKDGVIICTQMWGLYEYVDQNGNSSDYPIVEQPVWDDPYGDS